MGNYYTVAAQNTVTKSFVSTILNKVNVKNAVKQLMLLAAFLMSFGVQQSWGQSVNWNLISSFTPVVCGGTATAPSVNGVTAANAATPNATYGYGAYGFGTTNSITLTNYIQFTFTNNSASSVTIANENWINYYASGYTSIKWRLGYIVASTAPAVGATPTYVAAAVTNTSGSTASQNNAVSIAVAAGSTVYFRMYGYYGDGTTSSYIGGVKSFTISVAAPTAPTAFSAASGVAQNVLSSTSASNVILAWNTTNTFGTPVSGTTYSNGNNITGGGTVLYNGAAGSNFYTHSSLTNGTAYYYSLWSVAFYNPSAQTVFL